MNDNKNIETIDEMLSGIQYLISQAVSETTQIYDGTVVRKDVGNKWKIRYNDGEHSVKLFGATEPELNTMVKVFVPQGNHNLSWFSVPTNSKNISWEMTLAKSGWSNNSITLYDNRFETNGYNYIISSVPANYLQYGNFGIYAQDVNINGRITFKAGSTPNIDLKVQVLKVKVE